MSRVPCQHRLPRGYDCVLCCPAPAWRWAYLVSVSSHTHKQNAGRGGRGRGGGGGAGGMTTGAPLFLHWKNFLSGLRMSVTTFGSLQVLASCRVASSSFPRVFSPFSTGSRRTVDLFLTRACDPDGRPKRADVSSTTCAPAALAAQGAESGAPVPQLAGQALFRGRGALLQAARRAERLVRSAPLCRAARPGCNHTWGKVALPRSVPAAKASPWLSPRPPRTADDVL